MDIIEKITLLKELGLNAISERLLRKKTGKEKLLIAIDKFRYASQEDLDEFNKEMKQYNKELVTVEMKNFDRLPPDDVLEDLKKARSEKCFDSYHISFIRQVKDPILFGKIDGFKELYFFISQWGDDVKIEDIIGND
jgi:hypothetical protein